MPDVKIPFSQVQAECPEAIDVMLKHRAKAKGATINKNADPSELGWSLAWAIFAEARSCLASELTLDWLRHVPEQPPRTPIEVESKLDSYLEQVVGLVISWKHGRYRGEHVLVSHHFGGTVPKTGTVPAWAADIVRGHYRPYFLEQMKLTLENDARSPQERARFFEDLLKQLRGPSFVEMYLAPKDGK